MTQSLLQTPNPCQNIMPAHDKFDGRPELKWTAGPAVNKTMPFGSIRSYCNHHHGNEFLLEYAMISTYCLKYKRGERWLDLKGMET